MTPQEAEVALRDVIARIDEARATLTPAEAAERIVALDAEVAELLKITGPRHHVGSGGVTVPTAGGRR